MYQLYENEPHYFCSNRWIRPSQVRATALTLAEMQAFLQNRKDEAKAAQEEIKNIRDELERSEYIRRSLLSTDASD